MHKIIKIIFSVLCFLWFQKTEGQITKLDSSNVENVVNEFYNWYMNTSKKESENVIMPAFTITTDSIVCLDFSKYIENLRKYNFTEELIKKEIESYKTCDENLRKITAKEYAKFDDLDDFINIDCDFTNSFRWIGGQEMIDGIRITNIDFLNNKTCIITIEYFSINGNVPSYWGNKTKIELIKKKNDWKINDINI